MALAVGSLFSGIGGFDLGLERAGMEVRWQVEIDAKCGDVLAQHWPSVRRYKDVREVGANLEPVDVVCGGFPCQDLSVAGRREGLAGERSGLWFEFHRVLAETRPRWVVIENVPGLLSSDGGRDFATIIRGLAELGYMGAARVLDAQYFGVAQRRRRVFIVGHLGDGRAAQVLFERESSAWDTPPSREAGEGLTHDVAGCLASSGRGIERPGESRGQDPIVAFGFSQESDGSTARNAEDLARPVTGRHGDPGLVAYGLSENQRAEVRLTDYSRQITSGGGKPGQGYPAVMTACLGDGRIGRSTLRAGRTTELYSVTHGVRRLTPTECERLQGFPDGWTDGQSDSARYRQLGNAVCVPVAEWIGRRIVEVEEHGDGRATRD